MVKIIKFDLTKKHKWNLRVLSQFLKRSVPPPKFDMSTFISNPLDDEKLIINLNFENLPYSAKPRLYNHCDTVACAVGHGPLAGIRPKKLEDWTDYSDRVFGTRTRDTEIDNNLFEWLFDDTWANIDNTPKGAAARIDFVLKNGGIPMNWEDQMKGDAKLCYKVKS